MDLLQVSNLANGLTIELIWLQLEYLIANLLRCLPCNQPMELNECNHDHVVYLLYDFIFLHFTMSQKWG